MTAASSPEDSGTRGSHRVSFWGINADGTNCRVACVCGRHSPGFTPHQYHQEAQWLGAPPRRKRRRR